LKHKLSETEKKVEEIEDLAPGLHQSSAGGGGSVNSRPLTCKQKRNKRRGKKIGKNKKSKDQLFFGTFYTENNSTPVGHMLFRT